MARIGEKFTFVAQITGKQEKEMGQSVGLKVKLKEQDLKEFDWTSFSTSAFDDFKIKDFVKVEGFFTENTKGKYPYRNIETDTPIEKASEDDWSLAPRPTADGQIIQPPLDPPSFVPPSYVPGGLASHANARNGESPEKSASIERQSSVNAAAKVCEIIASHYGEYYTDLTQVLTHAEENLPQFLNLAESIYGYFSNRAATGGPQATAKPDQRNGSTTKPTNTASSQSEAPRYTPEGLYEPDKLENIGHVLTGALKRWSLSKEKVCGFFGVNSPAEIGNSYSMSEAWESLKSNYDGPEPRE